MGDGIYQQNAGCVTEEMYSHVMAIIKHMGVAYFRTNAFQFSLEKITWLLVISCFGIMKLEKHVHKTFKAADQDLATQPSVSHQFSC